MTKAGFEALTPGKRVKGFSKGDEVKEGKLTANGIQGQPHLFCPFSFGVAGVEAGMTHELHAFGWDVLHAEQYVRPNLLHLAESV